MRSFRRTGAPALVATLALAVSALPSAGVASGLFTGSAAPTVIVPAATAAPTTQPAGKLVLNTASPATVTRLDNGGNPVGSQGLKEGADCAIDTDQSLINFSGILTNKSGTKSPTVAGFRSGSIGVRETRLEQFCNQVDTTTPIWTPMSETLVLGLNPAIVKDDFGPLKAKSASLQLRLRTTSVTISATATLDGAPVVIPNATFTSSAGAGSLVTWTISSGSDFRFDTLSLKADKGGFSLEGDAATGSTFDLMGTAEQVLPCGGSISEAGSGTAPGVTVTQLDATGCGSFDVILKSGPNEAEFLKPLDKSANAQFILDFVWTVDPANTTEAGQPLLPETTIDYDADRNSATAVDVPLRWCAGVVRSASGAVTGITSGEDQDEALALKQFSCILSQDSIVKADGGKDTVTVKQQVFLLGDAAYRFR